MLAKPVNAELAILPRSDITAEHRSHVSFAASAGMREKHPQHFEKGAEHRWTASTAD